MDAKSNLRDNILLKMYHHLDSNEFSMLEKILNESLYDVDVTDKNTNLPSTCDNINNYIFNLFELKRGMHLSEKTIAAYIMTGKELVRFVDVPLTSVKTEDIEYFLSYKKKRGAKNTTLNNNRRNLRSLFEFMRKSGFITNNPVDPIDYFKETKRSVDYLDVVSFDQLRNSCKDLRDRALLEWFRSTAMRVGEISSIKINDINWNTGEIRISGEETKTKSDRIVFLDELALVYLRRYITEERKLTLDSTLPLFTYKRGDKTKALKISGMQAEIRRIGQRSGLDRRIYPHLFRKTTATNVVLRGGTMDEAGLYLGHAPTSVTSKHYVGTPEETIKHIHNKYVKAV